MAKLEKSEAMVVQNSLVRTLLSGGAHETQALITLLLQLERHDLDQAPAEPPTARPSVGLVGAPGR